MGRVVVTKGVAGVGVAVGRILVGVAVGRERVGVDVGGRGVGVKVARLRVAVEVGGVFPSLASRVATLFSKAARSFLLAFVLDSDETLLASVVIRSDKPSSVSEDCACNCEKPNTNKTATISPIPTSLRLCIAVPPLRLQDWFATTATEFCAHQGGRNAPQTLYR